MYKRSFYIVNAITVYRLAAAFILLYFIIAENLFLFKWLLAISFFTDAVDGFLARKLKVVTVIGSQLDSIADDLTVLMAVIGMIVFKTDFFWNQLSLIFILLGLYLLQIIMALIRYEKLTSFHTYLAKCAAFTQGIFLVLLFFLPQEPVTFFYVAAAFTLLDLAEEITLVLLLPKWQSDVKGLYWVKKKKTPVGASPTYAE